MLILYDTDICAKLRAIQERYFIDSEEITPQSWRKRPFRHRILQNTARLADSLL
jgi:cardiolipin synthase